MPAAYITLALFADSELFLSCKTTQHDSRQPLKLSLPQKVIWFMISFGFSPSYFDWRECGNNRIIRLWNWLYRAPPAVSNSALCAIFLVLVDFHSIQKHQFRIERQTEQSVCAAVSSATSMAVIPAEKNLPDYNLFLFFRFTTTIYGFHYAEKSNKRSTIHRSPVLPDGHWLLFADWCCLPLHCMCLLICSKLFLSSSNEIHTVIQ